MIICMDAESSPYETLHDDGVSVLLNKRMLLFSVKNFIGTRPRLHHQYDHEAAVCRCWLLKTSCLRKRSVWAALVFISRCVYSACNRGGWCVNCDPSDCSSDAAAPGATDPLWNLDTSENKVQLGCQFLDQTDLRSGWAEQREIPVMILLFWNEVH